MRSRSIASTAPRRRPVDRRAALATALLLAFAVPAAPAATATSTAIAVKPIESRSLPRTVEAALARGGGRLLAAEPYGDEDVPTPSTLYVTTR